MFHGTGKHAEAVRVLNEKALLATVGIAGLGTSLYFAYDAVRDFNDGSKTASDMAVQLGISAAGAAASGALIGAQFGGTTGAVIGGLAGLIGTAITAWAEYDTEVDKAMKSTEDFNQSVQDLYTQWEYSKETLAENAGSEDVQITQLELLRDALADCVDENGNLKAGYEDRAEYILGELNEALGTEFKLEDILAGKYDTITQKIYELIEAKRIDAMTDYFNNLYKEAMEANTAALAQQDTVKKNLEYAKELVGAQGAVGDQVLDLYDEWTNMSEVEKSAYDNFADYVDQRKSTLGKISDALSNWITQNEEVYENLSNQDEAYRNNQKTIEESNQAIIDSTTAMFLASEKNYDELELLYDRNIANVNSSTDEVIGIYGNALKVYKKLADEYDERLETATGTEKEALELLKRNNEEKITSTRESMQKQIETIEDLTPEVLADWKELAETSYDEYTKGLEGLDTETASVIKAVMAGVVDNTKEATPTVKNAVEDIRTEIDALGEDFKIEPGVEIDPNVKLKLQNLRTKVNQLKKILEPLSATGTINQNIVNGINTADNFLKLNGFAKGGLPDMGELFVAREAGPELVGKIGNSNAVMNNQQIIEAVSSGVAQAVSSVMGSFGGSDYHLIIDGEQITNVIQRRMARNANITGMAMGV